MNDQEVEKQQPVPPFLQFCCAAVPMVFDDSLSYYEALCAMWKYLDDTVKVINNNALVTEEFIEKFNELKTYVDTYFDNLDVQDEIDHKLDQMVEDGTLQNLLNDLLQPNVLWTFDTVADMQAFTDFTVGGYAKTLGFHSLNDGGGATYYITNTGSADGTTVISLGTLYANLVKPEKVCPEIFGAYGDGVHDDVTAIRNAITYLSSYDVNVTSWQMSGVLHLLDKTYLINDAIIDGTFPAAVSQLSIQGDGTRSAIIAGDECSYIFYNDNKIGFSNISDIKFIGNDNVFLYEDGSQPQRLRFERCTFRNFHTICDIEGSVDSSEFVFDQCAISACGSDISNCELFIFNNAQAVNWRFYATDIETFTGKCFVVKKGFNLSYFQGSIIPVGGSTVYDFTQADVNSVGPANKPTITLYGVRYELRESSKLIVSNGYTGTICIEHFCCGMGGTNIASPYNVIDITDSVPQMVFHNCWNLSNYQINMVWNRSVTAGYNTIGFFKFYDGEYENILAMANRSTFSASTTSYKETYPQIYYNGQNINKNNEDRVFDYSGQIIEKNITALCKTYSASSGDGVTYNLPKDGYISAITLESVYSTSFGATATVKAEIYNQNNTKIGEGSVLIQGREKAVIQINTVVTTSWYVKLKHTYSNTTTLYIPHMLYAEYYS